MEKLFKTTPEEAREIVYSDHEDWEEVTKEIEDTSRWSIFYTGVFKHKPSDKLFEVDWSVGATEMQDESPFEYANEVSFYQVEPKEVKVIKYVRVV